MVAKQISLSLDNGGTSLEFRFGELQKYETIIVTGINRAHVYFRHTVL